MKRVIVLLIVAVAGVTSVLAQQVPMYSYYYYNKFIYNPAMAGIADRGQIYAINRNQWNDIPDAPVTRSLTADGPLRKKNIGVGLALFRDEAGQFVSTGGLAAYRYGIKFDEEQTLSFGMALGFLDNRIDFNKLIARDQVDPVIQNAYQAATGFDANIGVNYSFKTLNVGFSVPQVIGNELAYNALKGTADNDIVYTLARHIIANANYSWDITGDGIWFLEPTLLARITPGAPLQYDVNAVGSYQHKYWIGAMYRSEYAMTFSGGLKLADQFVLGYAYDMAMGANSIKNDYLRGAHEVLLGYEFGGRASDDPELKRKLKQINDRINRTDENVDSLGRRIDDVEDDVEQNRNDIDSNDDDIDDIRNKIKGFEDFMKLFNEDGTPKKGSNEVIVEGQVYTFSNVYFETNKWDIQGVSGGELNALATVLKENSDMVVEVQGHADERGTDSYNLWLSNKRSNAVRDYLISLGVAPGQLKVKALGESDPASSVLSENRRVEFKILSK